MNNEEMIALGSQQQYVSERQRLIEKVLELNAENETKQKKIELLENHIRIEGILQNSQLKRIEDMQERIDELEAKCKAYNNLLDNQKLTLYPHTAP